MSSRLCGVFVAALMLGATVLAGCGSEGATRFSGAGPVEPGGGGSLEVAIPAEPGVPDPLDAADSSSKLVARQVYEPLVARVPAPYGHRGSQRGLALGWRHSGDSRVWSFVLRNGVSFQDGTPLDGNAVVANADRWRSDPVGRAALPGLVAADAPSPDTVRFILDRAAPGLPHELSDPRLALVSPPALEAARNGALTLAGRAGTGPFQQTPEDPDVLVRYPGWWGSPEGLGPALDEIRFRPAASMTERETLINEGATRLATGLSRGTTARLSRDPLLAALQGAGADDGVAIQRSVRGVRTAAPIPFSSVWLTVLGVGAN